MARQYGLALCHHHPLLHPLPPSHERIHATQLLLVHYSL
jgi:hypothetical protein